MSHVSKRMREWPRRYPCEAAAMHDCAVADSEDFCAAFPEPDNCPKYRRMLIHEREIKPAGWEFNRFEIRSGNSVDCNIRRTKNWLHLHMTNLLLSERMGLRENDVVLLCDELAYLELAKSLEVA